MKRARLLVLASTVSMLGWGAILPYQYAYAANTRHWGGLVAAAASSLFSVGALVAAPIGGRLADRFNPARVVVLAQIVAALASACLIVAGTPVLFLLGMFFFGAGISAAIPVETILVLRWVRSVDRRRIFALLSTGSAIGMAIGAFAAGYLVKGSIPSELLSAIRKVAGGGKHVSPSLAEQLAMDLAGMREKAPHEGLSDREYRVLRALASGKGLTETAHELCLSTSTVATYRSRILSKLNLKSTADLIRYAVTHQLVE